MDSYGRRSRNRRRCHSQSFASVSHQEEQPRAGITILGSIQGLFIMASLLALIYMMLEYHCQTCKDNCDLKRISKSIDDTMKKIKVVQEKYQVLEGKVQTCSQELPRIEGQVQTLEAIIKLIENGEFGHGDNYNCSPLPKVRLYISRSRLVHNDNYPLKNSTKSMNISKTLSNCQHSMKIKTQKTIQ